MNGQNKEWRKQPLSEYERALVQMAKKGQIDLPVDDELAESILDNLVPVELTKGELEKLSVDIRKVHQDKAIERARAFSPKERQPFGRYLCSLRSKAELTVVEIARRLEMDSSYLENIEADRINPMQIMRERIVDIMELFRIPFSEFVEIVEESLVLAQARTGRIKTMARSSSLVGSRGRGIKVSHALDAALVEIARQEGRISKEHIQIDEEYLKGIKEELIQRNRADLLV